jgi:hypothetical protein
MFLQNPMGVLNNQLVNVFQNKPIGMALQICQSSPRSDILGEINALDSYNLLLYCRFHFILTKFVVTK